MKNIAIDALVAAAVVIAVISVLGMLRMRDPYQRLHYISGTAALTPLCITIAIFLQDGIKPESFKAVVVTLVLIAMNTVVTHAAARAFRLAETKDWNPDSGEEVPIHATDEVLERKV